MELSKDLQAEFEEFKQKENNVENSLDNEAVENNEVAVVEDKKEISTTTETDADEVIKNQREKDLQAISENEDFKKASGLVNQRDVYNKLKKKANELTDEELSREWEEYLLKKKKEEQDYQTKLEKNLIKQKVKAEVYNKKREIAKQRYGYLYGKDMKDFTPSKTLNRLKEFRNWYNNLSETVHKIVKTTLKWLVRAGIITGSIFALYGILKWLLNNGIVALIN